MSAPTDGSTSRSIDGRPKRREVPQLTGIRIVAAFWVVLFHFGPQYTALLPEAGGFFWLTGSRGFLAVDLFFVLSGYILAYQHLAEFSEGRGRYGRFLLKRIARIYPVHVVTLLFLVIVVAVGGRIGVRLGEPENFTLWGAVQDLLLIRGWFTVSQGWNFPAWSLSAEWLAYLVCLLVMRASRLSRGALVGIIVALVLVEGLGAAALPGADAMPVAPIRVLTAFACGVALFRLTEKIEARAVFGWIGGAVLLAVILATPFISTGAPLAMLNLVATTLVVGLLAIGRGPVVDLLGSRPLEYGGRVSFSVYMAHGIVLLLSPIRFIGVEEAAAWPLLLRLAAAIGQVVLVFGAGVLLYHLIEKPGQKAVLTLSRRRQSTDARGRLRP